MQSAYLSASRILIKSLPTIFLKAMKKSYTMALEPSHCLKSFALERDNNKLSFTVSFFFSSYTYCFVSLPFTCSNLRKYYTCA